MLSMSKTNAEPYLADDPDGLKKAKLNARLTDKRLGEDIRAVMDTASGRRVLWWLLEQAAIGQDPMTGNSMTFYRLGEQAIGKKLHVEMWKASKQLYRLMQDENE